MHCYKTKHGKQVFESVTEFAKFTNMNNSHYMVLYMNLISTSIGSYGSEIFSKDAADINIFKAFNVYLDFSQILLYCKGVELAGWVTSSLKKWKSAVMSDPESTVPYWLGHLNF